MESVAAFYFQEDPVKSGISDLRRSEKRRKAFPQKLAESLELIERGLRHVFAGDRAETDHIPEITDYFALFKCHKKPPCLSGRFRRIAAAQREMCLTPARCGRNAETVFILSSCEIAGAFRISKKESEKRPPHPLNPSEITEAGR